MSSRQLLILRHATAMAHHPSGDHKRDLSPRGQAEITQVARHRADYFRQADHLLYSSASRTTQTMSIALQTVERALSDAHAIDAIYNASCKTLLSVLKDVDQEAGQAILLGHNPGVSELQNYLSGIYVGLAPAQSVLLNMPDNWETLTRGCAQIVDIYSA